MQSPCKDVRNQGFFLLFFYKIHLSPDTEMKNGVRWWGLLSSVRYTENKAASSLVIRIYQDTGNHTVFDWSGSIVAFLTLCIDMVDTQRPSTVANTCAGGQKVGPVIT